MAVIIAGRFSDCWYLPLNRV